MVFGNSTDRKALLHSPEMSYRDDGQVPGCSSRKSYQFAMDNAAFETVRNHIASLEEENTDLIFLKTLMESPVMSHLVKVQDKLEDKLQDLVPIGTENTSLASDICSGYDRSYRREAKELTNLLRSPNFKALLEAHDIIATEKSSGQKSVETGFEEIAVPSSPWEEINILTNRGHQELETERHRPATPKSVTIMPATEIEEDSSVVYAQPIRVVGLRKSIGQPLGVTVEESGKNLVVARILSGGMIDRLGLLKVGDVILEINSVRVSTPQQLQTEVARSRDTIQLKVVTPVEDKMGGTGAQVGSTGQGPSSGKLARNLVPTTYDGQKTLCFMRALFTYDPSQDTLLPCKEIGLGFTVGDILQIVDQSDPNWWQAKKVGESVVGLVPSRELEERRAAFVRPEADFVHSIGICGTRIARKKKRCNYTTKTNSEYDRAELSLYEEVTRMPPFRRKTLILVGASGVGRRTLKNRLINSDGYKFGSVLPMTSRPPLEGEEQMNIYTFVTREEFEEGIRNSRFLEFGEKDGNYYGTTYDSVREVIRQGKMCIIDCNPTVLKLLHSSPEFMPYVVFLAAPGADRIHQEDEFARSHGYSSRNVAFDRMSSIRYSSRRARTLESIASLYEEEDSRVTVEESQRLQRLYMPYFDIIVVNEDFDTTFRRVSQALESLGTDHQWVPVSWVY